MAIQLDLGRSSHPEPRYLFISFLWHNRSNHIKLEGFPGVDRLEEDLKKTKVLDDSYVCLPPSVYTWLGAHYKYSCAGSSQFTDRFFTFLQKEIVDMCENYNYTLRSPLEDWTTGMCGELNLCFLHLSRDFTCIEQWWKRKCQISM